MLLTITHGQWAAGVSEEHRQTKPKQAAAEEHRQTKPKQAHSLQTRLQAKVYNKHTRDDTFAQL
jgi:hypothetical protein